MTTLLVDDDPFALKLLARQLAQVGLTAVTLCQHAHEAIALLESHGEAIDLVFCDLQMPDIDGVEFVRHLADIGYRGSLVLMSGEDGRILQSAQKLARAYRVHILAALSKPIANEGLRQVLERKAARAAVAPRAARDPFRPAELKRAIVEGELVNHYQPKVDLTTGTLLGSEALVRWQHPQAGLVFPDEFIPIAEEYGLIDELTYVVLRNALRHLAGWRQAGLHLQMAVNVSMDNLASVDFPDAVARLAGDAGIALPQLVLEITESRLMKEDLRIPLDIVTRLRLKRIGLSIDDFGTGYSSLVQLRDLPFDELKLDRSFVNGAADDRSRRAIVESALAMARQLDMKSVGEGVENRSDWDLLRTLGCNVAQGYFIARPMPGDDLPAWSVEWERRRHGLVGVVDGAAGEG